ncbi:MAG TPA: AcvB/VirJ family lysyl-phosphatidylglycerol hydrolase [Steroidobacteraceae bacterium]|nr:AcvB/VirJ family lysyl-phosphatidylglycerol hydrolase [Steroidobacteraceae bacterium]
MAKLTRHNDCDDGTIPYNARANDTLDPHFRAAATEQVAIVRKATIIGAAALLLIAVVGALKWSGALSDGEVLSHGRFHDVHVYKPKAEVQHFVLFLSGDGGWGDGLADIAKALAAQGTLVAGIDTSDLFEELEKDGGKCVFPVGDLENLSHFVQAYYHLPTYFTPILIGHSAGASLAYAAIAQAPPGTFTGALSLSFCADLDLHKPLCKAHELQYTSRADGGGVRLVPPSGPLQAPWIALHGTEDDVCSVHEAQTFVAQTPGARFVLLPGVEHNYEDMKSWMPQFDEAYSSLLAHEPHHAQMLPRSLADLPLVEVQPTGTDVSDTFAVLFSGDGGWAGIDKDVATALAARGVPVAGWDSLRYFWTARTPAGVSNDLDRILRYYSAHWQKPKALVIGYSQGADVLPFAVNRLPARSRALIERTALIGIGKTAAFEFHVTNWFGSGSGELPIAREMAKMSARDTLCLYGDGDQETICPQVSPQNATLIKLTGGHHFGGSYTRLADVILAGSADVPLAAPSSPTAAR